MSRHASGLHAWTLQRATAIYLGLYSVYLVGHFLFNPPVSYEMWSDWVATPLVSFSLLLFFVSLLLHAWVGMRDVLMDYVLHLMLRVLLLTFVGLALVLCGLWVMKILFLVEIAS